MHCELLLYYWWSFIFKICQVESLPEIPLAQSGNYYIYEEIQNDFKKILFGILVGLQKYQIGHKLQIRTTNDFLLMLILLTTKSLTKWRNSMRLLHKVNGLLRFWGREINGSRTTQTSWLYNSVVTIVGIQSVAGEI